MCMRNGLVLLGSSLLRQQHPGVIPWALKPLLYLQHSVKEVEPPELGAGRGASDWLLSPQTTARVGPENKSPSQAVFRLQLAPGRARLAPDIRSQVPTPNPPSLPAGAPKSLLLPQASQGLILEMALPGVHHADTPSGCE